MESRVVAQHRPAARPLRRVRRARHVLRARLGRRAASGARAAHRRARPRDRLARLRAPAGLRPDARRRSATTCAAPSSCSRTSPASPVRGYRAPSYSITPRSLWALDVLIEEGYQLRREHLPDPPRSLRHSRRAAPPVRARRGRRLARRSAGVDGPRRPRSNLPVAGGGYFRLLPYCVDALGHRAASTASNGQPAIFYLHPWEIDPEQPRLPAGALGRFRHYRNLDQTEDAAARAAARLPLRAARHGRRRLRGMTRGASPREAR